MFKAAKPIRVLLVEDSESDIYLISQAFSEKARFVKLSVVRNADEALLFLNKQGDYEKEDTPCMVLLDLNMPEKNGFQLLQEIKANHSLTRIPVIILSVSNSDKDIYYSYELKASSYIVKPMSYNGYLDIVSEIQNFWSKIARLPYC